MIILGLWVFSSHHIKGTYYQNDLSLLLLTLITVVEVMSVKFFHCKIKECHYAQSAVKEVWLYTTFLRIKYLHKGFEILLYRGFISSSLFTHSFLSAWTHGYLFYILLYNPILFDFIAQIVPTLTTGSIFDWLLCLFDILCHCGLIFFSKISLLSGTTRYCRLNLFISYIIFRISKKAWFLWSEMVLETKILAQGILNKYVFNGGKGIVNVCQRRVSCHKKYQNNWWYLKGTVHWMTRRNCLDLYYCLLILLVQRENLHFILVISNMGIYFPNMVNELEALSFSQTKTLN